MEGIGFDDAKGAVSTKRVFYEGSDALLTGYGLCYNFDYGTAASKDPGRCVRVEKPATANLEYFAGVVHPSSNNVTGPRWIQIITEGFPDVYTDQDLSGSWGILLWPQDASYALGAKDSAASAGATTDLTVDRGRAKSLQEVNRSGTNGVALCALNSCPAGPFVETSTA